jgi:hypothetical protein
MAHIGKGAAGDVSAMCQFQGGYLDTNNKFGYQEIAYGRTDASRSFEDDQPARASDLQVNGLSCRRICGIYVNIANAIQKKVQYN